MNKRFRVPLLLLYMVLCAGCATVEKAYIPSKMGSLEDSQAADGILMYLAPDQHQAKIGDLLTFSITLKNVSNKPIWIPKQPDFLMTWIYPDGKRDNLVQGSELDATYTRFNTMLLGPGQERTYRSVLSTYYFNSSGITEFRALVSIDNAHSRELDPFWNGHAESNGYGVLLK